MLIAAAADRLTRAAESGAPRLPVRDLLSMDPAAGYTVQQVLTQRRLASGSRLIGRKVGLTNARVQAQMGVDQPDFGALFDDMALPDGSVLRAEDLLQPRIEAEVAITLAHDLDGPDLSADSVRPAVAHVVAALEIVDSRITNWDISIVDTVADNASSGRYILGGSPVPLADMDLRQVAMSMSEDDIEVATGSGADCLGDPLAALAWLATVVRDLGAPLRAGDVVLSGALGPMIDVRPGASYYTKVTGLGSATVTFVGRSSSDDQSCDHWIGQHRDRPDDQDRPAFGHTGSRSDGRN